MKIKQIIGILPFVIVVLSTVLHAQRVDTIRANPDAVQLRKIWQVTGGQFGGGRVGDGIGSVGDINGDGLDDWAVHEGDAYAWKVYYGSRDGLSTTPVRVLQGLGGAYPVVGDFWGTGHRAVGFSTVHTRVIQGATYFFFELHIFRTDSNRLDSVASIIFNPDSWAEPATFRRTGMQLAAVDLDKDGADELIIFTGGVGRGSPIADILPEVWIFRGGPNFQMENPALILHEQDTIGSRGSQSLVIGDADGDGRPDLITGSDYADKTQKQKFYFSNAGSPWNWTQPDRVVQMSNFVPLDCDGDGLLDIAVGGPGGNVSVFLSGSGKDARTRTLSYDDAELRYAPYSVPLALGYLSDSSHRYQMLGILGVDGVWRGFSGGPNGPDALWDTYSGAEWGNFRPIGDINGDGWDEFIVGKSTVNFESGYAAIYAGGPYIPRDPSLGVRHISSEEREDAISIWPNPATTEVHIAWRGDLQRMPRGFVVHDMLGRLVAEGEVSSWKGEVRWMCEGQPAGAYLLSILDYQGRQIAITRIIKT